MDELTKVVDELETKSVFINRQEFKIGKLTILQILKLSKLVGKLAITSSNKLKSINKDTDNITAILSLLDILSENEVAEFIGILLKTDDMELCKSISGIDISELIAIVCELNDFNKILKNAQRTVKAITLTITAKL